MNSVFLGKPDPLLLRRRTRGWRQIWVWLPVAFALAIIAIESTSTFSAENTSSWLRPIFEHRFGPITDSSWAWYHHIARKCGHFLGYALMCLAFLRAWLLLLGQRISMTMKQWLASSHALAIASAFFIASCDEWHQTFLPSRTGKVADVVLDTAGGIVLCCFAAIVRGMATLRAERSGRDLQKSFAGSMEL